MIMNLSPIQMEWFYYLEGEKTKLNWFLLEIALEYFDQIRDNSELASYRERYDEPQIAQFRAYYARRLRQSLLSYLNGRRKSVVFYGEYAGDFYPSHDAALTRVLSRVAREAFDHMWYGCKGCPQQCLRDHKARSPLFDEYKD